MTEADRLNLQPAASNWQALQQALRAQGDDWFELVTTRCPHLYAEVPVYISPGQLSQMKDVIAAVERIVGLQGWDEAVLSHPQPLSRRERGVFYGYDFHLNTDGAHLIEINTNAGGAYLVALLAGSQREVDLPGELLAVADPEAAFIEMFRNEWRKAHDAPLRAVAIVDEQPEAQYLYPEFLLAQAAFERAGIAAPIADPAAFTRQADGLYLGDTRIDLIYNRLTDFDLQQHAVLSETYLSGSVLVTPNPEHYARYADKRNLVRLTDAEGLCGMGAGDADIAVLLAGVPLTLQVNAQVDAAEQWWATRKQWFFKPDSGYGSKGAYRGDKLTRRVFEEIMQGGYVAQRMAAPGERVIFGAEGVPQSLKYDVRCYVYDGAIQLIAARLYQGQTTNFRTPGGGFAQVRLVG